MALIADILLISGAFGAAFYCMLLSRRLSRLSDLDGGVGKAIADLNAQVTDLTKTLQEARTSAAVSAETLADLTNRAEAVAGALDTMLSAAETFDQPGAEWREPQGQPNGPATSNTGSKASGASGERTERPAMPSFVRGRAVRTAAE